MLFFVDLSGMNLRTKIEALRAEAAVCLASKDLTVRARATGFLKMAEVLKVQMLARGEEVVVTSREGNRWIRKV